MNTLLDYGIDPTEPISGNAMVDAVYGSELQQYIPIISDMLCSFTPENCDQLKSAIVNHKNPPPEMLRGLATWLVFRLNAEKKDKKGSPQEEIPF